MSTYPEEYTDGYVLFCGHRFQVDPRALIPRLETEELVKYCVRFLAENSYTTHIADVGTGSGIIPISITTKTSRPLQVFATDLSADALDLASENYNNIFQENPLCKGGKENHMENRGILNQQNRHIPYREDLTEKARELRKNMTGPEKKIWYTVLRKDTFKGFRFLRQKPLLDYIVDFYCHELGLVIELDGFSHNNRREYDTKRTEDLEKYGLTVFRTSNDEVLYSFDSVCANIETKIKELQKNKSSPPRQARGTSFTKEVSKQIHFLQGNLLEPIIDHFGHNTPESILITANLPYVREKEINSGLIHEPRMAFLGGVETGFELYEKFFEQLNSWKYRPKKCHIVIEFGLWQRDIAETVFQKYGWGYSFFEDLRGIERFAALTV